MMRTLSFLGPAHISLSFSWCELILFWRIVHQERAYECHPPSRTICSHREGKKRKVFRGELQEREKKEEKCDQMCAEARSQQTFLLFLFLQRSSPNFPSFSLQRKCQLSVSGSFFDPWLGSSASAGPHMATNRRIKEENDPNAHA